MPGVSKNVAGHLFTIERELAGGSGAQYEARLAADALVVIRGQVLDKTETVAAMNASPGWDEFEFSDERAVEYDDTVVLSYKFTGTRGDQRYEALLSSVYVSFDQSEWLMALHQQTPLA